MRPIGLQPCCTTLQNLKFLPTSSRTVLMREVLWYPQMNNSRLFSSIQRLIINHTSAEKMTGTHHTTSLVMEKSAPHQIKATDGPRPTRVQLPMRLKKERKKTLLTLSSSARPRVDLRAQVRGCRRRSPMHNSCLILPGQSLPSLPLCSQSSSVRPPAVLVSSYWSPCCFPLAPP
jgi:hypothetical protein